MSYTDQAAYDHPHPSETVEAQGTNAVGTCPGQDNGNNPAGNVTDPVDDEILQKEYEEQRERNIKVIRMFFQKFGLDVAANELVEATASRRERNRQADSCKAVSPLTIKTRSMVRHAGPEDASAFVAPGEAPILPSLSEVLEQEDDLDIPPGTFTPIVVEDRRRKPTQEATEESKALLEEYSALNLRLAGSHLVPAMLHVATFLDRSRGSNGFFSGFLEASKGAGIYCTWCGALGYILCCWPACRGAKRTREEEQKWNFNFLTGGYGRVLCYRCSLWSCCLLGQLEIEPGTASFGKILSCLNNQENKLYPVCPGCRRAAYTSGCFQHGQSQKAPQVPLHRIFLDQETSLMRTVNHRSSIWTRVFEEGFRARLLDLLKRKGSWNDWVVLLTTKANVGATSHILSIPLRQEGKLPSSSRYQEHQNCGWKITDDAKEFPCDAWRLMYPCTFLYAILVIGGGTLQHEAAWPNEIERPVVPEDLFVAACEYLDIDPRSWDMRTDPVVGDGSFQGGFAQLVLKKVWGPRGAAAVPSDDFLEEWWEREKELALRDQVRGGRENDFRESCWSMYNRFLSCSTIRADAVAPGTKELQERCEGFVQTFSFDRCPDRVAADGHDDHGGHAGGPSHFYREEPEAGPWGYRAEGGACANDGEQPAEQGDQASGLDPDYQEEGFGGHDYDDPIGDIGGGSDGEDAGPCSASGLEEGLPAPVLPALQDARLGKDSQGFAQPFKRDFSWILSKIYTKPVCRDPAAMKRQQHARPHGPREEGEEERQAGERGILPGSTEGRGSVFPPRARSEASMSVPSCLLQSDCALIPPSAFFRREASQFSVPSSHGTNPLFKRAPGSGFQATFNQQRRKREGSLLSSEGAFKARRLAATPTASVVSHRSAGTIERLADKHWHHMAPIPSDSVLSKPLSLFSLEQRSRLSRGLQVCTPSRKRLGTSNTDENLLEAASGSFPLRTPPGSIIEPATGGFPLRSLPDTTLCMNNSVREWLQKCGRNSS